MLWTISGVLVMAILWLLGLLSGYKMGNFIHILLVVAIAIVMIQVIRTRSVRSFFYGVLYFLACLFDMLSGFLYILMDFLAGLIGRALLRAAKWPKPWGRSSSAQ